MSLKAEAEHERQVADSPEAQALQEDICKAVRAYSEFLNRNGVIWEYSGPVDCDPRLKAGMLVVTQDYNQLDEIDIRLQDGAIDRVHSSGVNPDYLRRGPTDIPPHERRKR